MNSIVQRGFELVEFKKQKPINNTFVFKFNRSTTSGNINRYYIHDITTMNTINVLPTINIL